MFSYIAENVADYFIKRNVIPSEDKEVIQYGVEITLSTFIGFSVVMLTGIFIGFFIEALAFLLMLVLIKKYTGGYHANTYLTCNICTIGIFIANVIFYKYMMFMPGVFWFALGIISCFLIGVYAPCEHINHPLAPEQKRRLKKISVFASIAVLILAFLLYAFKINIYMFIISTLATICINLILGIKIGGKNHD